MKIQIVEFLLLLPIFFVILTYIRTCFFNTLSVEEKCNYLESRYGIYILPHSDSILSVSYSSYLGFAITGSKDKTVRLWDVPSKSLIHTFYGHLSSVSALEFSSDSSFFASGSWDNSIKIWSLSSNSLMGSLHGHRDWVTSIKISKNNNWLISGSRDRTIRIWDLTYHTEIKVLEGHKGYIWDISVDNNEKYIISASSDNTVIVWDLKTGVLLKTLKGHLGHVNTISANHDSSILVSGAKDKHIKAWDLDSGSEVKSSAKCKESVSYVRFLKGLGLICICVDSTVHVIDPVSLSSINEFLLNSDNEWGFGFHISDDGKYILYPRESTLRVFEVATKSHLNYFTKEIQDVFINDPDELEIIYETGQHEYKSLTFLD